MPHISTKPTLRSIGSDGGAVTYDDLQVNVNVTKKGASPPRETTYDFGITSGVEFGVSAFDVGESVFIDVQTIHSMALNTVMNNHIHFTLPNTTSIGDKFKFQLDVIGAGIDGVFSVPTGSPFTAEYTIEAGDNTKHLLLDLADIPSLNTTVSSVYKMEMTRIAATANEYGSEVYILFNDCHIQLDTIGSQEEKSK